MGSSALPIAIIGAGPYGLSIAAHLRARGIEFRIFGTPMHSWRAKMPAGMFLKSEGFASSLYDADGRFTLRCFCAGSGLAYGHTAYPIPLETFCAYGLAFQQRFVPEVEDERVMALDQLSRGFDVLLASGDRVSAQRVVIAVGISYFSYVPAVLAGLPADFLSHSSDHRDLTRFKDRDVIVVGAGASALDLLAGLDEAGARVRLVARRSSLTWTSRAYRPLWKQWYPKCGLGPGLRNRFYASAPMLFRHMASKTRLEILRTWLGPSGGWPVRDRVERLPRLLGYTPRSTELRGGLARLCAVNAEGRVCEFSADHIIAATGYRVDLRKLPFLSRTLSSRLRLVESAPVLSADFQSSVPGLYFVGLASAYTFGPIMRFVLGARHTARRLAAHCARPIIH